MCAALVFVATACGGPAEPTAAPAGAPAAAPATATAPPTSKPSVAPAAADPAWHYEGAEGPEHWGSLSPKFSTCGTGRSQSPIDIANPQPGGAAAPLTLQFPPSTLTVAHHEHVADGINNGHTIQINYTGADTLTLGSESYGLAQYHFHGPSEHTVNGKHSPMEMHLVHKSAGGKLAVVGVLIDEGAHNKAFDPVWANLPTQKGMETHYPAVTVDVDDLLPSARRSYRYEGSLTTPPCSEGVSWIVMTTPIQLSAEQIRAFTQLIRDNNRPTQPLNGRTVVTDAVAVASR
jgi:carbonic anhydrase